MIVVESAGDGRPVTTLTGTQGQASLQGLLRRLYSLGPPLNSVNLDDSNKCAARDQSGYPMPAQGVFFN